MAPGENLKLGSELYTLSSVLRHLSTFRARALNLLFSAVLVKALVAVLHCTCQRRTVML